MKTQSLLNNSLLTNSVEHILFYRFLLLLASAFLSLKPQYKADAPTVISEQDSNNIVDLLLLKTACWMNSILAINMLAAMLGSFQANTPKMASSTRQNRW
ncbi:MAG: hypothetical protein HRT35_15605 [Algicola sp.]|nr:hypothetical protein [Algicola sp.]